MAKFKRKAKDKGKDKGPKEPIGGLTDTVADIRKEFGDGAIMRLGDDNRVNVAAISTGSLSLDLALGVGGVPRGRVVEIFGPESSGKTTLALTIVAQAQQKGGIAAYIDAEHALDPSYARRIGVNLDDLLVSQPDAGEQALEICERLVRSNAVDVVVIDSVAALVPRAELEGEMGDTHVGLQARLMSQALRKLTGAIHKTKTCVIFINQVRMKIGVMWGNPETTPGGRALKFYSSVRMDIRRIGSLKEGEKIIGNATRVKVVKNKVAPPFRQAEFDIMFNKGISWEGTLLDIGVEQTVVDKSGAWLSYGEMRLGQGREQAREFLLQNKDVAKQIEDEIRAVHAELSGDGEEEEPTEGDKPADATPAADAPPEKASPAPDKAKPAAAKKDTKEKKDKKK